ncbi:MAG: phosphoribosylformylglycinamidine synthase subunit PurQ, partial [bacterium]
MRITEDRFVTRWGVVIFPGSNCDHDAIEALGRWAGQQVVSVWHKDKLPKDLDGVVLPGGFSYGDYLRSGAIARFSPVMDDVVDFAYRGGLVIGICNGFQILTEVGLLPGALGRNVNLRFICRNVYLRVERTDLPFTHKYRPFQILTIPIAHNEGCYYLPSDQLDELEKRGQVVFRYCNRDGKVTPEA